MTITSVEKTLVRVRIMLWVTCMCSSLCIYNIMGLWHVVRVTWRLMDDTLLSSLLSIARMGNIRFVEQEVYKCSLLTACWSYAAGALLFVGVATILERWISQRTATVTCESSSQVMLIVSTLLWSGSVFQFVTASTCALTSVFVMELCRTVRAQSSVQRIAPFAPTGISARELENHLNRDSYVEHDEESSSSPHSPQSMSMLSIASPVAIPIVAGQIVSTVHA